MEADKRYFFEGLFVVVLAVGAAFFFVWLGSAGHRDDVLYRIYFNESVSGLGLGQAVKFQGVDVGSVKSMTVDSDDPRRVQVDIRLRKETPVTTDTRATLRLKGITGVVFIELEAGRPTAARLAAATPAGEVPVIPADLSTLATVETALDQLPQLVKKFSAIEDKAHHVATDVGELTARLKQNPSLLLRRPKAEPQGEAPQTESSANKPAPRLAGHP